MQAIVIEALSEDTSSPSINQDFNGVGPDSHPTIP